MAGAHGKDSPTLHTTVVSTALAAPFNLEVTSRGILVADGGLNLIGKVARHGSITTLAKDQPGASGVALSRNGRTMAFTTTVSDPGSFINTESGLNIWGPRGHKTYVDTHAFEVKNNPDKVIHYGVKNPSKCVTDALTAAGLPVTYTGEVDSHAYSVAAYGDGWVVADAGANVVWKVDRRGRLSTLAVLPAQPLKITAEQAGALGLPACVVGITYNFESVPTDVEVGRDGALYVTTLPGGPESPVLGARGSVYRLNANGKHLKTVATGFLGATNLALAPNGDIYVAELFGGKISVVHHGKVSTFLELPGVVAVETCGRSVWAATLGDEESQAPGTIVEITRRGK
ncbi:ScyD/ScyE family protein [Tessaracoccus antarcticus]|uniref:ScyD/ScyE family protein n=2 Tax=Tessaracoccus antarcticus TaxID=2479848 RepID=A0A3M0GF86_9ACTN|nr:ScyD/ScyE family protein [Tessaracoccus antarcticus]